MITTFKIFEYHEENLNKILDKINKTGKDTLNQEELDLLENEGDIQTHFESGDIIFDVKNTNDYGDTIKINGVILYHGKKYDGYFELSKEGNDPMSLLHHFGEFEPNDDDWYNLDDLIQDLENIYISE
jgi:hypothetical protein